MTIRRTAARPLYEIAEDIKRNWDNIYFGAMPHLEAMFALDSMDDMYGMADARSIVAYFLSNATSWRGEDARRIKAELNSMLKTGKTASRVANSGDDFTDSTKTAYTLTEWSVSVTSPNRWMSTPGVWDGAPNAILNVHKTVDEPNEFGGIGKSVKHPEYDGLTFDSVDEAWAFAESKGLVSKRGSKTAEYDWDSNPQGRDREHYFCAECGVEGTYENQLRLLPSGRRVCRNCEVYRGVKAKRKTAADVWVGGGDDWVPLDYAQKDHEPDVGDFIGTMSTCRICKGTVIRDQDASGRYIDRWVHVQAEKATRRRALNEQSGYAESDLEDVEVDDDNADEEPMFPWEIKESPEEVREAGLNVWAQNGFEPGGESDPPHVEVTDPQAQESFTDEGWAEQDTSWESGTISEEGDWRAEGSKQANSADYQAGFEAGSRDARTQPTMNTPGANMVPYGHSIPEGASSDFKKGYHEGYQSATTVMMGRKKRAFTDLGLIGYEISSLDFHAPTLAGVIARDLGTQMGKQDNEEKVVVEVNGVSFDVYFDHGQAIGDSNRPAPGYTSGDIQVIAPTGKRFHQHVSPYTESDKMPLRYALERVGEFIAFTARDLAKTGRKTGQENSVAAWVESTDPWGLKVLSASLPDGSEAKVWQADSKWHWTAGRAEGSADSLEAAQAAALAAAVVA